MLTCISGYQGFALHVVCSSVFAAVSKCGMQNIHGHLHELVSVAVRDNIRQP